MDQNDVITPDAAEETKVEAQPEIVEAVKRVNARRIKTERKPRGRKAATAGPAPKAAAPAAASQIEKDTTMNFDSANWMNFAPFTTVPGADKFQSLFAGAGEQGQQVVERSRAATEQLVEMTKANVEALAESGRVAAAGVQTLGQEAVARTRENLEQAATQVKSLTDVQSPTEFFQRQGEFARGQFDRMVADSSRFAESLVKLAGEAMQPLSTRAAINADKLNELSA
jgi:phasin family protein